MNERVSVRRPNDSAVAKRGVISKLMFMRRFAINDEVAEYSGRRNATSADTALSDV